MTFESYYVTYAKAAAHPNNVPSAPSGLGILLFLFLLRRFFVGSLGLNICLRGFLFLFLCGLFYLSLSFCLHSFLFLFLWWFFYLSLRLCLFLFFLGSWLLHNVSLCIVAGGAAFRGSPWLDKLPLLGLAHAFRRRPHTTFLERRQ